MLTIILKPPTGGDLEQITITVTETEYDVLRELAKFARPVTALMKKCGGELVPHAVENLLQRDIITTTVVNGTHLDADHLSVRYVSRYTRITKMGPAYKGENSVKKIRARERRAQRDKWAVTS